MHDIHENAKHEKILKHKKNLKEKKLFLIAQHELMSRVALVVC